MTLSAVYRCVNVISDAVAQLPLEIFDVASRRKLTDHPCFYLLAKEPNRKMSRYTFIKTLVDSYQLTGNGYAYIRRDRNGNAIELIFLESGKVTAIEEVDKKGNQIVTYFVAGYPNPVNARDMIHVTNYSTDGVHGISTLSNAARTLGLASDSEAHAAGFFRGGANISGILTVQGVLSEKQAKELKKSWNDSFSPQTGNPNGVAVMGGNMDFKPISVNPVDAQLLETRKFNVDEICRFFGVNPLKCFDLTYNGYNTYEAMQLSFLTDTLAPILEKMELEFERKLFTEAEKWKIDVRFDTSVLLRGDKTAEASYYSSMFNMGVMSVNEIRAKLDMPPVENGDDHFMQSNITTMANIVAANVPQNSPNDMNGSEEPQNEDEDERD